MNKIMLTVASALVLSAQAVDFLGVDASGSGDLADGTLWGGGGIPTSEALSFIKPGTLNASAGISFTGTATIDTVGPLVFDSANPVSFNNLNNVQDGAQIVVTNGSKLAVTNGFNLSASKSASGGVQLLVTGEGTEISQRDRVVTGLQTGRGAGSSIVLADHGSLSLFRLCVGSPVSGDNECGHSLVIGTNCILNVSASYPWFDNVDIGVASSGNTMDVYGSFLQPGAYCRTRIGVEETSSNNIVTVQDGGSFSFLGTLAVGEKGSFNELIVKSGGNFTEGNEAKDRGVFIGKEASSSNNLVKIEAGAAVSMNKRPFYVGYKGSYNTLDYANPTCMPLLNVGTEAGSVHNSVYIHGDGTQEVSGDVDGFAGHVVFGAGTGNVMTLENFTFTTLDNSRVCPTGAGNKMVFRRMKFNTRCRTTWSDGREGSTYEFDNSVWSHYAAGSQHWIPIRSPGTTLRFMNGSANDIATYCRVYLGDAAAADGDETIEVLSGSTVTFSSLFMHNSNNRLIVSNATLNINQSFADLTGRIDKNSSAVGAFSTNLVIRFEGTTPKLASTMAAAFAYEAGAAEADPASIGYHVLEYALPEAPYAAAPFQASSISLPKTTKIRLNLNRLPSRYSGTYVLAEATGSEANDKIVVSDFAELGSELPKECRLVLSDDQKQLKVKFPVGAVMVVR